jgi:hypothetical protein
MGKTLLLKRTPLFLRVVIGADGSVDALDQPDDEPRPDERLYAYRFSADKGGAFVDGRDDRGRRIGGAYRITEYSPVEPQPGDDEMRTRARWVAWCEATHAREARP